MNPTETKTRYSGIILAMSLCVLWMVATGAVGTLGFYEYPRDGSHLSVIITVLIPTVFFAVLFILFPTVRNWTSHLNLGMFTLPQNFR